MTGRADARDGLAGVRSIPVPDPDARAVRSNRCGAPTPYGLFAVMTTERPEITVEGSDDGETWKPYRFRWKPCELDRRPRFTTPHMPRLDWQMWFAALGRRLPDAAVVPPVRAAAARGLARGARPPARDPVPRPAAAIRPRPAVAVHVHPMGLARLVGQRGRRAVLPADRIATVRVGRLRPADPDEAPGLAVDRVLFDNSSRRIEDGLDDLRPELRWT